MAAITLPKPSKPVDLDDKIRNIIAETVGIEKAAVTPKIRLREELGFEEIYFLDLVPRIESYLGQTSNHKKIKFPDWIPRHWLTVEDVTAYVNGYSELNRLYEL